MQQARKRFKELFPGAIAQINALKTDAVLADSGKTVSVPIMEIAHDAEAETITVKAVALSVNTPLLPISLGSKQHEPERRPNVMR